MVVNGFLALCVMITIATPAFASHKNILNLLRQSSIIGIISAGMTFVIISGNFDISVGAVAALSGGSDHEAGNFRCEPVPCHDTGACRVRGNRSINGFRWLR